MQPEFITTENASAPMEETPAIPPLPPPFLSKQTTPIEPPLEQQRASDSEFDLSDIPDDFDPDAEMTTFVVPETSEEGEFDPFADDDDENHSPFGIPEKI